VFQKRWQCGLAGRVILSAVLTCCPASGLFAGGGLVLEGDTCIIWIDFYSAHFTAYQPESSGNEQFCQDLPDVGDTIFVMDYLHQSLKEVPVGMRIIRDVTGQGGYVKLKHVEALDDLEKHTVFFEPPKVYPNASLKVEFDIMEKGSYIGIVSAGHPTTSAVYLAVFPFEVGASRTGFLLPSLAMLGGLALFFIRRKGSK